jgi:pyrroline-5-carboxylate reductase
MPSSKAVAAARSWSKSKVAVLGVGKIGTLLLEAMFEKGLLAKESVEGTVQHADKAKAVRKEVGIRMGIDNLAAVREADVVLVCVKPQTVGQVLEQIAPAMTTGKLVISVAASVPTDYMEKRLPDGVPIVRAMPNTPAVVACGMTALCKGSRADNSHIEFTKTLFDSIGRTVVVDEKHMDAITGLSASGPAFIYIIIESLADAGVKVGLPRELATLLAAQTTMGAAKVVLETGHHPALLKDQVTTPAGCTIDGILELEEGKLRVTLIKAVVKAAHRARELVFC